MSIMSVLLLNIATSSAGLSAIN